MQLFTGNDALHNHDTRRSQFLHAAVFAKIKRFIIVLNFMTLNFETMYPQK